MWSKKKKRGGMQPRKMSTGGGVGGGSGLGSYSQRGSNNWDKGGETMD